MRNRLLHDCPRVPPLPTARFEDDGREAVPDADDVHPAAAADVDQAAGRGGEGEEEEKVEHHHRMNPIAYARNARDESLIERILDEAGIPYSFTLDATEGHSVCFLARRYDVEPADADRARQALRAHGAASAVVDGS